VTHRELPPDPELVDAGPSAVPPELANAIHIAIRDAVTHVTASVVARTCRGDGTLVALPASEVGALIKAALAGWCLVVMAAPHELVRSVAYLGLSTACGHVAALVTEGLLATAGRRTSENGLSAPSGDAE
jgi:hypothetical protein